MFLLQKRSYMYRCLHINLFFNLAYVCGEKSGLLTEKPFKMGETLSGNKILDINIELELMKQKLKELQDYSEQEISQTMKDFGMTRFAA